MPILLLIGLIFTTLVAVLRTGAWLFTSVLILKHNAKTLDEIKTLKQTPFKILIGGIEHIVILATLIGIFLFIF